MIIQAVSHPRMNQNGSYGGSRAAGANLAHAQAIRRQKSGRIGHVLRRLLGRKGIRSQISVPSPTERKPTEFPVFITSAIDPSNSRTVSLPANQVSRTSALGSHAPFGDYESSPFGPDPLTQPLPPPQPQPPPPPLLRRRASMPSVVGSTPEPFAEHTVRESTSDGADVDAANIGYAVTSGSHPRRRSRSAHDLYELANGAANIAGDSHRRSDEVRHGHDSPDSGPAIDAESQLRPPSQRSFRSFQVVSGASRSQPTREMEAITVDEVREDDYGRGYPSFDFQRLAKTFNQQETIPLEDRMTIAEVKLMDLEYAISKLQTRSPSPPSAQAATPRAEQGLQVPPTGLTVTPQGRVPPPHAKSEPGSGSTTAGTVLTQPTAPSLSTAPDDDPFVEDKSLRPLSVQTSLHRPEAGTSGTLQGSSQPRASTVVETRNSEDAPTTSASLSAAGPSDPSDPSAASPSRSNRPVSLTSISIDHFTTLITLLKREQHARIRLEEEIAELRRDVWHLMYPSPAPTTTAYHSSSPNVNLTPVHPSISQPAPQHPPPSAGGLSTHSATSAHSTGAALPPSVTGPATGSLYRQRRWDGSRRDVVRIDDFHVARRRPSYEGAMTFYDESESPRARESTSANRSAFTGRERSTGRASASGGGRASATGGRSSAAGRQSAASSRTGLTEVTVEDEDSASETFVTPIEPGPPPERNPWMGEGARGGRFEIAAGLWGRGEGEAF